jgi:hypothetical protein
MIFVLILGLALLGTLGCIATLVYALRKDREIAGVITNVEVLRKRYSEVSALALAEAAINSADAYVRTERVSQRSPERRQTYRPALVPTG